MTRKISLVITGLFILFASGLGCDESQADIDMTQLGGMWSFTYTQTSATCPFDNEDEDVPPYLHIVINTAATQATVSYCTGTTENTCDMTNSSTYPISGNSVVLSEEWEDDIGIPNHDCNVKTTIEASITFSSQTSFSGSETITATLTGADADACVPVITEQFGENPDGCGSKADLSGSKL